MIAAVLGVTGYTGQLLARLLSAHPQVRRILPCSSSRAGERLTAVDPGLAGAEPKTGEKLLTLGETVAGKPDVVFSALPHLESARLCAPFFGRAVVIDLSADFRLRDADAFRRAYGEPPARADLLPGAVYGLAEWHTEAIQERSHRQPGLLPDGHPAAAAASAARGADRRGVPRGGLVGDLGGGP